MSQGPSSRPPPLPFPESLCHRCAAPPRYVRTARSVFILCPKLPSKYPRQPVQTCLLFVASDAATASADAATTDAATTDAATPPRPSPAEECDSDDDR